MEIYDPLHGIIEIDELSKRIINTEEFQRLRNIKQLGCCYYVFPGASHNRFEHSLGVYHLAKKYVSILNKEKDKEYFNESEERCVKTAGLIHDIGHGPFSHLFDDLLPEEKNHEYRSGELFKLMNQKYSLGFSEDEITMILGMIYPEKAIIPEEKKYLYQIVSNQNGIDVDRFDYIMRDIKMIGLNYGIEYERIMNRSKIVGGGIHYSEKTKTHIEDFFRTRFIMYKEVYNHHSVRGIEYMMKEFIKGIEPVFGIKDIILSDNWGKFIELTDSLIDIIYFIPTNHDIKELINILHRIKTRKTYKSVGYIVTNNYYMIHQDSSKIIVDSVKVKYYGQEKCIYYKNGKKIYSYLDESKNKDEYILNVFYKEKEYKQEAKKLLETSSNN
jgi:HD superfamily phosphohydrolase